MADAPNTREDHLAAILAMRTEWTEADRLLADQLADLRDKLATERSKSAKAPTTVSTAKGGRKANPIFAIVDRLSKQEAALSRRLGLGLRRTKSGRYDTVNSPLEKRAQLWRQIGESCKTNLIPGQWLCSAWTEGVEIAEDAVGWPNNPKTLPEAGKTHEVGRYYPVSDVALARARTEQ
jgi:hypothetical protein